MPENHEPQPFLGTVLGGVAMSVGKKAIEAFIQKGAERVMNRADVPVQNKNAAVVAEKIAEAVAPGMGAAVVEAIKADPVINVAINGEPMLKSKQVWIAIGGLLSSIGGILVLYSNGTPDGMDAYMALIMAATTSGGAIWRRAQFRPKTG